tara:strand:- start:440 stop:1780 length:1341 start_codon:yes stop_codon:yes gene_type:complete
MKTKTRNFEFKSILFESERIGSAPGTKGVEMKHVVTDIDIFESLERSYITAKMLLNDERRFIERLDIIGGERITITLVTTKESEIKREIVKKFYIAKVLNNLKPTDDSQSVLLHLVEDIGYISNLHNVNRFYNGKCSEIIQKLCEEFLEKELAFDNTDVQIIKAIIPNLTPLDASRWLKNRATTIDGYPFYFYSTLIGDKIAFKDLGTLYNHEALNKELSYRFGGITALSPDTVYSGRTINGFRQENSEDLLRLQNKGLIGGKHKYINSGSIEADCNINHDFDIVEDVLAPMINRGDLGEYNNPLYSNEYLHNNKPFNEYSSRTITQLGGSNSYRTTKSNVGYDLSYSENYDVAGYKLSSIARATNNILLKSPITVAVDGSEFINGNIHSTIGNKIHLEFLASSKNEKGIDNKLSGEYLIYESRHLFKVEKHDLILTCAKLGNMKQ